MFVHSRLMGGARDRVFQNVAIRFRCDDGRIDARCTVTMRGDDVLVDVDPEVPGVPPRILGRKAEGQVWRGIAVGPDGEVLAARWADVGSEQVGLLTGEGYDCLFTIGELGDDVTAEETPAPRRPRPPRPPVRPDA